MDDIRIERDLRIPLRDGIRLAANLYRPAAPGRYPALLQYTPYLKDGFDGRGRVEIGQIALARRGYACLSVDVRGYGESEGLAAVRAEREVGRPRRLGVDRGPAVVHGPNGRLGHLVRRRHGPVHRVDTTPVARRDRRHPRHRRLRAAQVPLRSVVGGSRRVSAGSMTTALGAARP
jgi:hypothetical protein